MPEPLTTPSVHTVALGLFKPKLLTSAAPQVSPLPLCAAGFDSTQSGTPLPLSVQVRVVLVTDVAIGFAALAMATTWTLTYRPIDALMAVRPLPNTSYAAPTRGSRSFQHGMQSFCA